MAPSASVPHSTCVPTVYPISHPPVVKQKIATPYVAMNKSVKTFDGLDHQYTPGHFFTPI